METAMGMDDRPPATPAEIWAILRETSESQKETARRMQETDRLIKDLGKQMGGLHNSFGDLAEHLVAPRIHERFNELGYSFDQIAPGGIKIYGKDGKVKAEIDLLLENGDTVIAVEVKTHVKDKDVERHLKRLEILSEHFRKKNDRRKIQGAIAGAVYGSPEKETVIEAGMYVIEQTGDTMMINIPDGFVPREW